VRNSLAVVLLLAATLNSQQPVPGKIMGFSPAAAGAQSDLERQ